MVSRRWETYADGERPAHDSEPIDKQGAELPGPTRVGRCTDSPARGCNALRPGRRPARPHVEVISAAAPGRDRAAHTAEIRSPRRGPSLRSAAAWLHAG